MAILTVNEFARGGTQSDGGAAAAAGGDQFPNTGIELVVIKNGGGAPITATFTTPGTVDGNTISDKAVSIPAGQEFIIGPFPTTWYSDATGRVSIAYSAVTSVTIRIVRPTDLRAVL